MNWGDLNEAQLVVYLTRHGWVKASEGLLGSIWMQQVGGETIAVPRGITSANYEWAGIVDRIGRTDPEGARALTFELRATYADVAEFAAEDGFGDDESIALSAGEELVTTAHRIYRSSATTARRPTLHIGRNFSVVGDRIAERARMGHTRRGSYLVPILMPIPVDHEESLDTDDALLKAAPESPERRVTRTMAQSLAAIASNIVEPGRDPRPDVIAALQLAGASRETVTALQNVLSEPGVERVRTTFRWSAGTAAPAGLPESVTFPSEAAELLGRAADMMRKTKVEPGERFTGRIIEVRHPHGQRARSRWIPSVGAGHARFVYRLAPMTSNSPTAGSSETRRFSLTDGSIR